MKTEWDYTSLADAYLKRPDYANEAISSMLAISNMQKNDAVADIGAGVAHLTIMLALYGLRVDAVEPNDAMRANGIKRTQSLNNVKWHEGTGENSTLNDNFYHLVSFGSSFNVCNRPLALRETNRLLKQKGWFACMWNHRRLDNEIQPCDHLDQSSIAGHGDTPLIAVSPDIVGGRD